MEKTGILPSKSHSFGLRFFKRFLRLLPWFFPSVLSQTSLLFVFLLCLGLLDQYLIYNIGLIPSKYYKALGDKDQGRFWMETVFAALFILAKSFIKATVTYVTSFLYLIWRDTLTRRLHGKYFKEIVYYAVNVLDKTVDNPDQRITQDVDKLCSSLSQILAPIIISPFTVGYYLYKAQQSTGYIGPVSVLIFFVIATVINKLLMSPVVRYVFQREKMEGNFRFKHMQIRSNSESAAFYRSGRVENEKTNTQLHALINTQNALIRREYALNFAVNIFDYFGSIISYITLAFPVFLGVYDSLSPSDLSSLISVNSFVLMYLMNCFTTLIDLAVQVTLIAGTTHRVVELLEVLNRICYDQAQHIASRPTEMSGFGWNEMESLVATECTGVVQGEGIPSTGHATAVSVTDLVYSAPKSRQTLCSGLSFQFEEGVNILVTGDSGCGKSSLIRIVNGIWPETRGTIDFMVDFRPSVILFLPQKPYFTDGSLRQQVIYPLKEFDNKDDIVNSEDRLILEYLEKVDLHHLLDRTKGLDTLVDWNWYDELSPGEMQRLSFVRLFYHKPKFAVLDESTSQMSLAAEKKMYSICQELGITLLSVGHRDSLSQYHNMEIHFEGEGRCHVKNIAHKQIESTA